MGVKKKRKKKGGGGGKEKESPLLNYPETEIPDLRHSKKIVDLAFFFFFVSFLPLLTFSILMMRDFNIIHTT